MSIQDEMGIPNLRDAQKALVMFVSELSKDDAAIIPDVVRARAAAVLSDWMMAGIIELAQRGAGGKPGGEL